MLALMVIALSLMSPTPAHAGAPGDSVLAITQDMVRPDSVASPAIDSAINVVTLVTAMPQVRAVHPTPALEARALPAPADSAVHATAAAVLGSQSTRPDSASLRHVVPTSPPLTLRAAPLLVVRRSELETSTTARALPTVILRR
ncbi:MAG: hypothetical protein ACTHU0_39525 [Kofleriaceae bacterium]